MTVTPQQVTYAAKRYTSGLTDVLIQIYNPSSTQVVTDGVMTEVASTGVYIYNYTPVVEGWHTYLVDSATEPKLDSGSFLSDYTTTDSATTEDDYGTTYDLAKFMQIVSYVPDINTVGTARVKETIGTGNGSTTVFWVDNARVIADTYTVYYGASESAATALTETTHYTLDKDIGKVTLTTAGRSLVGTATLYGLYSYVSTPDITNTILSEALSKAQAEVETTTHTVFVDGTDTTPGWGTVSDEEHRGQGSHLRSYFVHKYPLATCSTAIGTAAVADDTTLYVDSTVGFPSSGVIGVGADKVTYTGKSSTTFTGCTGVDNAHAVDVTVKPYVFEVSATDAGSEPVWSVLTEGTEFNVDKSSGRFYLYTDDFVLDVYSSNNPPVIPNRARMTYLYGYDTVPSDIKAATLMIASRHIMASGVRRAYAQGVNEFQPTAIDVDKEWLTNILNKYTCHSVSKV